MAQLTKEECQTIERAIYDAVERLQDVGCQNLRVGMKAMERHRECVYPEEEIKE